MDHTTTRPDRVTRRQLVTPQALLFLAVLALAVLAGCSSNGGVTGGSQPWYDQGGPQGDPTETTTTVSDDPGNGTPGGEDGAQTLTVFMDGWSHRTVGDTQLSVTAPDGMSWPLEFETADGDDIAQILSNQPAWMAAVGGRIVNTDFGWDCDETGCVTAGGEFPSEDLAEMFNDPGQIPGYGESYEGWGVEAGLWKASVQIPNNYEVVDIRSTGTEEAPPGFEWSSRGGLDQVGVLEPAAYGDDQSAVLVAAGLGRVFTPEPSWVTGDGAYRHDLYESGSPGGPVVGAEEAAAADGRVAAAMRSGLADTSAGSELAGLTNSELTYLTSPTIGCAPYVTCIPDTVEVEAEETQQTTETVCLTEDVLAYETAEDSAPVSTTAVYTEETRTVDLEHPTHINGVWGGVAPTEFTPATDPAIQLLSQPPLAQGTVELHVALVNIYEASADGFTATVWTGLGRVTELGAEEAGEYSFEEVLTPLEGLFVACP